MKVSEIPYSRYTIEQGKEAFAEISEKIKTAKCADDIIAARELVLKTIIEYATAASLSNCRFTLNTRDEFYQGEMAYYDEVSPLFQNLMTEYAKLMLETPFRPELEVKLSPRIFSFYEIAEKAFDEKIIADMQEENAVSTEYSKFMSQLVFDYNGKQMPLSVLRGYLEDSDRTVRKAASEAIGKGLEPHAAELDDFYDRLVKIRDRMAKKLGYKNFIELGYYRMNRVDYNAGMVKSFRDNVAKYLVPAVSEVKKKVAEKLGIDKFMFYDNEIYDVGETPKPALDIEGIFNAAQEMYNDMNPEIGAFMQSMRDAEAFDVIARDGKWGGGYCTCFPKYKQPFILANFNGSCGDIDVITHEFGHAFAAKNVFDYGDVELDVGGMETAECHSMSMEFFCEKYMDKFFGKDAKKYKYKHLLDALSFIPYGVIVDEFQHNVYENPEMTPAQRDEMYKSLEAKYRPYLSYEGIPYLEKGTRWQYQMHIFESPFYYIDYCLAQTVAIAFLVASKDDYDKALEKYIRFSKSGGTKAFQKLISDADLPSPFEDGALEEMVKKVMKIVDGYEK